MNPILVGKLFQEGFVPLILKEKKKERSDCIAQSQKHKRMNLLQGNLRRNEGDSPENDSPQSSPGQDFFPLPMSPSFTTNKLKFHWLATLFQNLLSDGIGSGILFSQKSDPSRKGGRGDFSRPSNGEAKASPTHCSTLQ